MISYKLISTALESKQPVWTVLNDVYKATDGSLTDKTNEVTEIVAKFTLYWLLTHHSNISNTDDVRRDAGKIISRINECYPFDVSMCLINVMRGVNAYNQFTAGPKSLEEVDDILSTLLKGNVSNPTQVMPATESLKDKVVDKLKSMFHLNDKKDKAKEKKANDKDDKADAKAKKDDKSSEAEKTGELEATREDATVDPEEQLTEQGVGGTGHRTLPTGAEGLPQSMDVPEINPPSDGDEVPNTNNLVEAHKLAWEVLNALMAEGGIDELRQ